MENSKKIAWLSGIVLFTGIVIGIIGAWLVKVGNPANMGICVACFLRDIAGALGLHRAETVQYIRPEIIGFVLGSFLIAFFKNEFRAQGGSSVIIRFLLGLFMMVGALMFLGCPVRMILRLAAGDLNASVGLLGFITGISIGILYLKAGFTLSRSQTLAKINGWLMPLVMAGLLVLLLTSPAFLFFSAQGPGSKHAPLFISLAAGLIVGVLAQRSRFCFAAGIRDTMLIKNPHLLIGLLAVLIFAFISNVGFKQFHLGFANQPIAHSSHLWNFLGMLLAGICATLLGGCPFRQLVLSGEGNTDSAITVFGMLLGAAFCHNFLLASSPKGPTVNGQIAVIAGIIFCLIIGYANREA